MTTENAAHDVVAAQKKYIDELVGLIDNVREDLRCVASGLETTRDILRELANEPDEAKCTGLVQKIGRNLEAVMPHTGINLSRLLLNVNARAANIPLMRRDPMYAKQPAEPPTPVT